MKMVLKIAFCCCLTAAAGMAQRGGGGGHGGGMGGGGMRGGGGMGGGGMRGGGGWGGGGGMRGGVGWGGGGIRGGGWGGSGWRGGSIGWGNRGGWGWRGGGWGWRGGRPIFIGGGWGWGWPGWGWGSGWDGGWGWGGGWPVASSVWDSSSYWPGYSDASYGGGSAYAPQGFQQQQPANNITVIYPPQNPQVTVNPVVREYDQFGQQIGGPGPSAPSNTAVGNAGSTLFLIALHDHTIRAAVAYWVQGNVLNYVTTEHETKQVSLDSVDRDLSRQINAERRVQFSLPSR